MQHYKRYHREILQKLQAALASDKPSLFPDLKKYIGTGYDFVGLSTPAERRIFKAGYSFSALSAPEQALIWNEIWQHSSWYEAMTQALYFVAKSRLDTEPLVLWEYTRHWVGKVDNWAHSDSLSDVYASVNPWERRQSVVSLLEYSKKREKILPASKLLGMVMPLLTDNHYFVQKGVGWTLREIGNVYPEKTVRFLEKHIADISPVAFTAAIEKLDTDTKERLKQWRRNYTGRHSKRASPSRKKT
jgi:3-methyladenine DNA glycosylase AlkD